MFLHAQGEAEGGGLTAVDASAQKVFDEMPLKDPVLWNVMLSCSITWSLE